MVEVPVFNAPSTTTPPITTATTLALSKSRLALQSWNPGFTLSLPLKLRKKILDLEYVEMGELMAESWRTQEDDQNGCCHQRRTRKGPVTDILLWVDCFRVNDLCVVNKIP